MRFDVITLFPDQFAILLNEGVIARAVSRDIARVRLWNPRDFTKDRHRTVDDRPFGGGPGMLMKVEPLWDAIAAARAEADAAGVRTRVAYLSPQGRVLDQQFLAERAQQPGWTLVCGRYEGIDERLIQDQVDEEWSVGDFVVSGGELPAMLAIDAMIRLLPGALGHADSAREDSHVDGLLDCPHYTRPEEVHGRRVPEVLLGGNHAAIARWRRERAIERTWERRPDLLAKCELTVEEQQKLNEFIRTHQASGPE